MEQGPQNCHPKAWTGAIKASCPGPSMAQDLLLTHLGVFAFVLVHVLSGGAALAPSGGRCFLVRHFVWFCLFKVTSVQFRNPPISESFKDPFNHGSSGCYETQFQGYLFSWTSRWKLFKDFLYSWTVRSIPEVLDSSLPDTSNKSPKSPNFGRCRNFFCNF